MFWRTLFTIGPALYFCCRIDTKIEKLEKECVKNKLTLGQSVYKLFKIYTVEFMRTLPILFTCAQLEVLLNSYKLQLDELQN